MSTRFHGLIAAPFTPFSPDRSLNLAAIPAYAELLRRNGVSAVFVCGTTGEGASLTVEERKDVATAWMNESDERLRVIVHVGHNCLRDARELMSHAADIGAAAAGALAPSFFKPHDANDLVDWCADIANAAPDLPFYYYHIPIMTGVNLNVVSFLNTAGNRIPSLAGVKYTFEDLEDFEECLKYQNGRFDLLFGRDELLLDGLQRGAQGAVGSTYNYAAPIYLRLIEHVRAGRIQEARQLQKQAVAMISVCGSTGVTHQAATKSMMAWHGVDCGPMRLPVRTIDAAQSAALRHKLDQIGYFEFACDAHAQRH